MSEQTKYRQIADNIKNKIYSGIYKPNSLLPYEKDLCERYQVSSITIRKAINTLVVEGFLYTVPGKGTFVYETAKNKYNTDISVGCFFKNGFTDAKLLYANIVRPDIYEVYNLQISPDEKIITMKWVIEANGRNIAYDIKSIPFISGMPLEESDLCYSSLTDILCNNYSFSNMKMMASITTERPTDDVSRTLMLDGSDMQVAKVQISLTGQDMKVCGWNTIYIRPDEFIFHGVSA